MRVLVDSSVLLDVMTKDSRWAAWSEEKLAWHAERDLLAINPIIYAEVSVHFASIEELDDALSPTEFLRLPLPYEAGFLARQVFPPVPSSRRPAKRAFTGLLYWRSCSHRTPDTSDSRRFPLPYLLPDCSTYCAKRQKLGCSAPVPTDW
jgi:hypothetical protein